MLKLLSRVLLVWLVSTTATQAATVLQDPSNLNNATGIQGLDIGGTLYDVIFEFVTDHSVADPRDIFWTPVSLPGGANDAALAINASLNADATFTVLTVGPSLTESYVVPYLFDTSPTCADLCTYRGSKQFLSAWLSVSTSPLDPETDATFARFTPAASAVPVPPAVYLFGSGLIGLAGIARRRTVSPV